MVKPLSFFIEMGDHTIGGLVYPEPVELAVIVYDIL